MVWSTIACYSLHIEHAADLVAFAAPAFFISAFISDFQEEVHDMTLCSSFFTIPAL